MPSLKAALLCVSLLLPACEGACPSPPTFADVVGLQVVPYDRQMGVAGSANAVRASELRLRLELQERLYTAALPWRGGFAAWADCAPPVPAYTEQVDSLQVTSRDDYDAQHPAGTPLNDVMRLTSGGGTTALRDFLARPQGVELLTRQYLSVTVPPARTSTQRFRVRLRLANGEVYQAAADAVVLQL